MVSDNCPKRKQHAVVTPEPTRAPRILGCQFVCLFVYTLMICYLTRILRPITTSLPFSNARKIPIILLSLPSYVFQSPLIDSIALILYLQASGAAARDIEKYNIEDMHDSIHSKSVMSLRAPISRGVLADFLSCMVCHSSHYLCINLLTNTLASSRCDSSRDQHAPGNPM